MLTRRAIVLGCALVVLGAACSSGASGKAAPTTTAAAPRTTRAPSSTTTTTKPDQAAAPDALQNLILHDLPGGFRLQPDDVADTGPTDLTKAALEDVSCSVGCDARDELTKAGFVDGYQRQWSSVDSSGSTVNQDSIYLYEFDSPAGAQQYAQHWRETLLTSNQGGTPVVGFTPLLVPGAVGMRVADRFGSTGVAIFTKGPYAVRAVVNGAPKADQSAPVSSLALLQYQRLP